MTGSNKTKAVIITREIKVRRERLGMQQTELANRAGIRQSSLSLIEKGSRNPSVPVLARIAAALGCTMDDLTRTERAD